MRATRRTRPAALALGALALVCVGCGAEEEPAAGEDVSYSSERVAPPVQEEDGGDVLPDVYTVEVGLDDGVTLALWIDPDDIRDVYVQYSDPADPAAWTEPELIFTAGDGCLEIEADAAGGTVAATLQCYEVDAFVQQAPDESQAAVTTDLREWELEPVSELYTAPVVSDDGSEVAWKDSDVTWTESDGFDG